MNKPDSLSKLQFSTVKQILESHPYLRGRDPNDLHAAALETAARIDKLIAACAFFSPFLVEKGKRLKKSTELVVATMEQWKKGKGSSRVRHMIDREVAAAREMRVPVGSLGGIIKIGTHTKSF